MGKSVRLILSNLYTCNFSVHICVPAVLHTGVIVPILKKPILDPKSVSNYRRVTVSSIHFKTRVNLILTPEVNIVILSMSLVWLP